MSDDRETCIRACVRPCGCEECGVTETPMHAPIGREATNGRLCRRCADNLREWLTDIPDLYATLDVSEHLTADETGVGKGKPRKASESPALARLDIVALQDPRTSATSLPARDTGKIEPWDGSLYIPGEMMTWADLLASEHHIRSRYDNLTDACGLLLRYYDRLTAADWVDECHDAVRDVVRLLRTAHGEPRPRPVGRCINIYERDGEMVACHATLYAPAEGVKIRCRSCGTRYDGQRMLLVKMQAERDREAG